MIVSKPMKFVAVLTVVTLMVVNAQSLAFAQTGLRSQSLTNTGAIASVEKAQDNDLGKVSSSVSRRQARGQARGERTNPQRHSCSADLRSGQVVRDCRAVYKFSSC